MLDATVRSESFYLAPDYYGGHRLVIDLYTMDDQVDELALVETSARPVTPLETLLSAAGSPGGSEPQSAAQVAEHPERPLERGPIGGYGEFGAAYTYGEPSHWSQLRARPGTE